MSCLAIAIRPRVRLTTRVMRCRVGRMISNGLTISPKAWVWKVDRDDVARTNGMTRKQRRLVLIGGGVGVLAVAVALMLNAFRDSIVFFNSPSDVAERHVG